MNERNRITSEQLDVFRELGTIGAGHATTALAQLLGKPVRMAVPDASILPFHEIGSILGNPEEVVVSGLIEMSGDMSGFVMLIQNAEDAIELVKALLQTDDVPASPLEFDEMQLSAISEVTNILVGAYVTAISSMTGLTINLSTPNMATDMVAAVMSVPAVVFGTVGDTVLFINSQFDDQQADPVAGNFFLVPDAASCDRMLEALGLGA